jgi:hypothetical protein
VSNVKVRAFFQYVCFSAQRRDQEARKGGRNSTQSSAIGDSFTIKTDEKIADDGGTLWCEDAKKTARNRFTSVCSLISFRPVKF